ncbi:cytochrome-c peroxidase [Albirhodobacter sp. R86504]|uniref:cytochrome-c peroxidase n=1 Tax=Albirhodobacter sp. R86504 TaxID=3093848 RepID=UPI00366CEE0E
MTRAASLTFLAFLVAPIAARAEFPAPLTDADYAPVSVMEAKLGQLLFYDAVLSGNRNISCATCHHPKFGTSDGMSLGLGEGAAGLGPARYALNENTPEQRIPRNSPALFNLGAKEFTILFHDGRIGVDPTRPSGLRTPMEDEMVTGFTSILSAQTMFPVLSGDEMAGHYSENDVAKAVRSGRITGSGGAWDVIAKRVAELPDYASQFAAVYPEIAAGRAIGFTDISNAIAAFIEFEWRSDTSPFDAWLAGKADLSQDAVAGAEFFYGDGGCATCHAGALQTDHDFHAMAAPQIGPGKAERFEKHSNDEGRGRVTGRAEDRFAFRTPSLRNVTATGPWGHAGAHTNLAQFLRDHAEPREGLNRFTRPTLPDLPNTKPDWVVMDDPAKRFEIAQAAPVGEALDEARIRELMAFLGALTDPSAIEGRLGIPEAVPSGLPIER